MIYDLLQAALTPEQRKVFTLKEEDDHFIHLFRGDKRVAVFTQHITIENLRNEADRIKESIYGQR